MTNELSMNDEYESLLSDLTATVTEGVFNSKMILVECWHEVGRRIVTDSLYKKWEQNKSGALLQTLAKDMNKSERSLYYAVKFYEKYPRLDLLPMGKNISWNKIVTQLLPANVEQAEERRCPTCGRKY